MRRPGPRTRGRASKARRGISKGALYHYFGSKRELLTGIVERTADTVHARLAVVTPDPDVDAIGKLGRLFMTALLIWGLYALIKESLPAS
ncbi:TetR/AcrR family transcriptional regulator [Nocardia sp. NPDC051832]|uniref:TetR/AcrR family transcriptional regulator n=1 Tax=Nocardia sp. NPDC051832 TaxID=3155673 RepID=UPI0034311913